MPGPNCALASPPNGGAGLRSTHKNGALCGLVVRRVDHPLRYERSASSLVPTTRTSTCCDSFPDRAKAPDRTDVPHSVNEVAAVSVTIRQ
jgi:hypothetical protein